LVGRAGGRPDPGLIGLGPVGLPDPGRVLLLVGRPGFGLFPGRVLVGRAGGPPAAGRAGGRELPLDGTGGFLSGSGLFPAERAIFPRIVK
jgi:hypothetical protein